MSKKDNDVTVTWIGFILGGSYCTIFFSCVYIPVFHYSRSFYSLYSITWPRSCLAVYAHRLYDSHIVSYRSFDPSLSPFSLWNTSVFHFLVDSICSGPIFGFQQTKSQPFYHMKSNFPSVLYSLVTFPSTPFQKVLSPSQSSQVQRLERIRIHFILYL